MRCHSDDVPTLTRSRVRSLVVSSLVVLLVVVGVVWFQRTTQRCGDGDGGPEDAVRGTLSAVVDRDDRALCQHLGVDAVLPPGQADVLRGRVARAGGLDAVTVREVGYEQLGSLHVVEAVDRSGGLVGRFQTQPAADGAVVVTTTLAADHW